MEASIWLDKAAYILMPLAKDEKKKRKKKEKKELRSCMKVEVAVLGSRP